MFEKIGKWVDSKGGVAHIIAGTWLFLLAAYGSVKPFHDFVIYAHSHMPGWVEETIAGVVPLIGFYKTWTAKPKVTELDKATPAA
jgi:hypothetical protein